MPAFNPVPQDVSPENAIDYSRGIPNSRVFQTLFGGVADAIHGYVNARDEQIKNQIYEDTLATTEKLQQPYIDALNAEGGATVDGRPGVLGPLASAGRSGTGGIGSDQAAAAAAPAAIDSAASSISRLQQAYVQGTVRDSYYHNQLNSMVKSLRANFPGYNQYIDSVVQNITGITPANALVADYFQEAKANAAALKANADKFQTFVDSHNQSIMRAGMGDVLLHPENYQTPEAQARVRYGVGIVEAQDANVTASKAALDLKVANGNANAEDYYQTYLNTAHSEASIAVSAGTNLGGDLVARLQKAQADPSSVSPDDLAALNAGLAQMLTAQQAKANQFLNTPYDDTGRTRAGDMHNTAWEADVRSAFTQPIKELQDAINNKDYGLAVYNANKAKAMLDSSKANLIQSSGFAQWLTTSRDLFGDTFVSQAISEISPMADQYKTFMRQSGILAGMSGQASLDQVTQIFKQDRDIKGDPKVVVGHIQDSVNVLMDPQSPPEAVANEVQYLYGDRNRNFLENFPPEQRTYVYNQLVNKNIAARIEQIGNPDLTANYVHWAGLNFASLFKADLNEVQKGIVNRKYLEVGWNPETAQITIQPTAGNPITRSFQQSGGDTIGGFLNLTPYDAFEGILSKEAISAVQRLNAQLTSIKPVIDLTGHDTNEEVLKLLEAQGFNPDAPAQGNFFDQLGAAIGGAAKAVDNYMQGK